MKKLLAVLLFVMASFLSVKGQNDYLITNEGEKVVIAGDASLSTEWITFKGSNDKTVDYKHKNMKFMTVANRLFLTLPLMGGKMVRLQEIVCYNDKYILTSFFQNGSYSVLVFDWDLKMIQPHRFIDKKTKGQKENIEKDIKPYFADCNKALDIMKKNIDAMGDSKYATSHEGILANVYAVKCGGTKDINELIKKVLASTTGK
jgi:hypothetical protein